MPGLDYRKSAKPISVASSVPLAVPLSARAALGHGSQRSKRDQEAPLICTDPFACCCPTGNRSRFRTWIPKEQEGPGSTTDLHRPLCLLLPHREQGAAEEPHGPSLDSPSTDCPSTLTTARGHIPLPAQRPSMEVTTVSPSPASPTEGDDLCETDVTRVAIHSVTLLICLCGLAGNGAVISLLSLQSGNYRIFNVAVANLLFLFFAIPTALLFLVEEMSCSPIMPLWYLNFFFQLSVISCYLALFQLIPISNVLYMYTLCWLCCHCDLPKCLWLVVESVQYWAFFALFAVIPLVAFLSHSQQQEHCQAALIFEHTIILRLFIVPLLISSTVNFHKAK
ncbi:uncharacterized protein LOC135449004 isoform X1 [Zonotrichia leucophrys gambelii]|uniref:uncharacterized protein LOC135449004 isoform X1 n=1 Tax=Zonotrichia leucophrys gambelii TaxID=257770 RepID=UPI0031404645